jgi:hypothetical protein
MIKFYQIITDNQGFSKFISFLIQIQTINSHQAVNK